VNQRKGAKIQILTLIIFFDVFVAITPQKHSNQVKDPNHACLQSTSINIARPHKNGSIETKLIEGVGNLRMYPIKHVW
jgi:hypothetical protein